MMPHTVTYYAVASHDQYGKPTHATTGTSYSARVKETNKRVTSRVTGDDVLASHEVWIAGTPTLDVDGKLELPDGSTPKIVSWDRIPDESGSHHVKVYLGV
jgi:hypothetical protein